LGPAVQDAQWSSKGVTGASRFLSRVYNFVDKHKSLPPSTHYSKSSPLYKSLNLTIKKVNQGINNYTYNTAIAALMSFLNELYDSENDPWVGYSIRIFVQLLAPFAPHLAEELWIEKLKNKESVFKSKWPEAEEMREERVNIIVQVNGKMRGKFIAPVDLQEEKIKEMALKIPNVAARAKKIKKVIFIPNKLINFVCHYE
jgi:leucyl-tRNA synthetase